MNYGEGQRASFDLVERRWQLAPAVVHVPAAEGAPSVGTPTRWWLLILLALVFVGGLVFSRRARPQ